MSKIWVTRGELRLMIREAAKSSLTCEMCGETECECDMREGKKKKKARNNPWAICTASTGRGDEGKYERCVKGVKKQRGMK